MEYTIENLQVCQMAEKFSDEIWNIVEHWDYFKKDTIGKQITRSADSIQLIFRKDMGDTFIKKASSFIFMPGAQYKKRNPGYRNVKEET